MRTYRTLEAAGNWRAVCGENRTHGSGRGGWKRAGRLVLDTTSLSQHLAGRLLYVNARVEQERAARRLPQEPVTGTQAALSVDGGDEQAARLARLAEAAAAQGYSLDRLEQMLGIEGGGRAKKNG
jgi:hypothetical protein